MSEDAIYIMLKAIDEQHYKPPEVRKEYWEQVKRRVLDLLGVKDEKEYFTKTDKYIFTKPYWLPNAKMFGCSLAFRREEMETPLTTNELVEQIRDRGLFDLADRMREVFDSYGKEILSHADELLELGKENMRLRGVESARVQELEREVDVLKGQVKHWKRKYQNKVFAND